MNNMIKQMESFMKNFPDATPKEKMEFLKSLRDGKNFDYTVDLPVVCLGGEWGRITPDGFEKVIDYIQPNVGDPFGLLDGSLNDYRNDYIQSEIISRANYNPKPDTEADRIIKDLLYLYAVYMLEQQKIQKDDDTN